MIRRLLASTFAFLLFASLLSGCDEKEKTQAPGESAAPFTADTAHLAACLRDNGWVMYSSFTCSACRAQRKAFGAAFSAITEIECNPHAPNAEVARCVEKKILKTPTWIQEKAGIETNRLTGFQKLEVLAQHVECAWSDDK